MRQHFGQAPIGHRALVEVGADQCDAALVQPRIHLVARIAAEAWRAGLHVTGESDMPATATREQVAPIGRDCALKDRVRSRSGCRYALAGVRAGGTPTIACDRAQPA